MTMNGLDQHLKWILFQNKLELIQMILQLSNSTPTCISKQQTNDNKQDLIIMNPLPHVLRHALRLITTTIMP